MNKIKHSKYKNTGILFELLIRQITADTLDGKDSPAKEILKQYFVKTELGKEYKLYEALIKKTSLTEAKANIVVSTLLDSSKGLNKGVLKRQKYNLINEIKKNYDLNQFFSHKLPNYKIYAAFYTLIESINQPTDVTQTITNKITILEHLTAASLSSTFKKDEIIQEIENSDKETKLLAYKIIMEKFNSKYNDLHPDQKEILREYINSTDNTSRLKEFYLEKINEIKSQLIQTNKKTKNQTTKIKINEIIPILPNPDKNYKITDNDLIDLLQYYSLLNELKMANG